MRSSDRGMFGPGKRGLDISGERYRVGKARNIWEAKDGEIFGVFLLRHTAVMVRAMEGDGGRRTRMDDGSRRCSGAVVNIGIR